MPHLPRHIWAHSHDRSLQPLYLSLFLQAFVTILSKIFWCPPHQHEVQPRASDSELVQLKTLSRALARRLPPPLVTPAYMGSHDSGCGVTIQPNHHSIEV